MRELCLAGTYIKASEETLVRKFMSLLPQSLQMAVYQFSPDLSTTLKDLTDHVAKLPVPQSFATAPVAHNPTPDEEATLSCATVGSKRMQGRFQTANSTQGAQRRDDSGIVCFNCGLENHVSRFCLAPKSVCSTCGGKHKTTFCDRINRWRNRSKNAPRS